MRLSSVVRRFAKTSISGWDGVKWVANVGKVDFLASSRFVSAHEFDTKVQYVLAPIDDLSLDNYAVVRVDSTQQIWLVGMQTQDVSGNPYSKFYAFRRAESIGELYSFSKTLAVSGMAKSLNRELIDTCFCSVERVTSVSSKEFTNTKYPDVIIYFPRTVPLTTSHEAKVLDKFYDVKEVYNNTGFVACRAIAKSSV